MLLLLLALPVGIYLFLRGFGENKFDVPVYHQDGIEGCAGSDSLHYFPGWQWADQVPSSPAAVQVVSLMADTVPNPSLSSYIFNLTRVYDALLEYRPWRFVTVLDPAVDSAQALVLWSSSRDGYIPDASSWYHARPANHTVYRQLLRCGLGFGAVGLDPLYAIVLIDSRGRVRGYYEGVSEKDTDRLILESKIILQNIGKSKDGDD